MGRPSKSASTIESEGVSHRTKEELEVRAAAEASLLSGEELFERPEVRRDKIAHKEFRRLMKILTKIGKNDALYSSGINLHCQLYGEIAELEAEVGKVSALAEKLEAAFDELDKVSFQEAEKFARQITKLLSQKNALRSAIDRKRNMMFAIDKENVMTVSSALRSIPKSPQKPQNPVWEALNGDNEDDGQ